MNLWGAQAATAKTQSSLLSGTAKNRASQIQVRISLQTHHPSVVTYFLVSPLFPSAGAWCCLPNAPLIQGPRQVPAVKMQRAMSALQTMLLRCSVPSWMRLGKSFLGQTKCFRAPAAPLPPVGYRRSEEELTPGANSPGSFGVWRRKAKRRWRGESAVCPAAPGALLLHPSRGSQGPPAPSPNPSHPALLRRQGHPLAFYLPAHGSQESQPRAASAGQWALDMSFQWIQPQLREFCTVLKAKPKQSVTRSLPSGIQLSFVYENSLP